MSKRKRRRQMWAAQWEQVYHSVVWGMLRNAAYTGQAAYRKTQAVFRQRAIQQASDYGFYPKHIHWNRA
jgi:hypothetical protein